MLRKIVAALILVPLAIVIVAFALANRQGVTVSLDPFGSDPPAASATLPMFALIIVVLIAGVLVGGGASWLGQSKWRRRARRLEREIGEMRAKNDALQATAAGPNIVPREQDPPLRLRLRPPAR